MRTNPVKKTVTKKRSKAFWTKFKLVSALVVAFVSVYFFFFKILFF
jgi:predicted membrane-bound mannosyltransferase